MKIERREFLFSTSAFAVAAAALISARTACSLIDALSCWRSPVSYKVGPLPSLPPLPRYSESVGRYLFADGRIVCADGYCVAFLLHGRERLGFARKIPSGIEIETDTQKLWLLGRGHFAPDLTAEIMATHARDPLFGSMAT
jgi:hypothetical protein